MEQQDFYTIKELAKRLGISRQSVLKRAGNGSIKARKMGRNYIIFKKDIDLKKLQFIIKH